MGALTLFAGGVAIAAGLIVGAFIGVLLVGCLIGLVGLIERAFK